MWNVDELRLNVIATSLAYDPARPSVSSSLRWTHRFCQSSQVCRQVEDALHRSLPVRGVSSRLLRAAHDPPLVSRLVITMIVWTFIYKVIFEMGFRCVSLSCVCGMQHYHKHHIEWILHSQRHLCLHQPASSQPWYVSSNPLTFTCYLFYWAFDWPNELSSWSQEIFGVMRTRFDPNAFWTARDASTKSWRRRSSSSAWGRGVASETGLPAWNCLSSSRRCFTACASKMSLARSWISTLSSGWPWSRGRTSSASPQGCRNLGSSIRFCVSCEGRQ